MKTIITNNDNLKEEEITEISRRVKILMIDSKNNILLGYSHHEYQFPGGHVEEGEDLISAINREVQEETGIILNQKEATPFACLIGYYKDWPSIGKNIKIEFYYYEINIDEKPNLDNTNYTESELDGNFELRYIPLENVEEELIENTKKYEDKHGIVKEMLKVLEIYKNHIK